MSAQVLIPLALHDTAGLVSCKLRGEFLYGPHFYMQIKATNICADHRNHGDRAVRRALENKVKADGIHKNMDKVKSQKKTKSTYSND